MGFINFRGGLKEDHFQDISASAKRQEADEQERLVSIKRRRMAAAYFGVPRMADRDNKQVLEDLVNRYNSLRQIYNKLKEENPLTEHFDDNQLMKDFWLTSFFEVISQGDLSSSQTVKALQLLLVAFQVGNQTTAEQHILFLERNEQYRGYIERCFGKDGENLSLVWSWFEHLGNQPLPGMGKHGNNRMDTVVFFINEYAKFMLELSFYLGQLFPGKGCGQDMKIILDHKLELIGKEMSCREYMTIDLTNMIHPIYGDPKIFRSGYQGFQQTEDQSKGLSGAFDSLRKGMGQEKRMILLMQLLDACCESKSRCLENEFKRTTRGF